MWLTHLDHSPPLKETKTGTQAEQEPETMKEPCLLTCLMKALPQCLHACSFSPVDPLVLTKIGALTEGLATMLTLTGHFPSVSPFPLAE